jgi:hypothetical protein
MDPALKWTVAELLVAAIVLIAACAIEQRIEEQKRSRMLRWQRLRDGRQPPRKIFGKRKRDDEAP